MAVAPSGTWAVVGDANSSLIVHNGQRPPIATFAWRVYEAAFSAAGVAALRTDGTRYSWVIIDSAGVVRAEGRWGSSALSRLATDPAGLALTYSKELTPGTSATVTTNVSDKSEAVSVLPEGSRYYSGDGRILLVLNNYPGNLQLFDVSISGSPVAITPRIGIPDRHLITGAVSPDGSHIAVQYLEGPADGTKTLSTVSYWNRSLQELTKITTTTTYGLMFQGQYLIIGAQRNPDPAFLPLLPTSEISVYDCALLQ